MLASSRLTNMLTVAMPYARWAAYVIQLGYAGYNLFELYKKYKARFQQDQMNGYERTLNQTTELVIKTRRRNITSSRTSPNLYGTTDGYATSGSTNGQENQGNTSQGFDNKNAILDEVESVIASSLDQQPIASTSTTNNIDDNEVSIVYDSRSSSGLVVQNYHNEASANKKDETVSNLSTSIESTDSNEGIIHDIYTHCFICTRSLTSSEKPVATLPFCLHPFHESCLDGVLKWHSKCPVCDCNIFSPI